MYYFPKGKTDMDVYRAEVTFLIPIGEMDFFFFSIILCCIIGYCYFCFKRQQYITI